MITFKKHPSHNQLFLIEDCLNVILYIEAPQKIIYRLDELSGLHDINFGLIFLFENYTENILINSIAYFNQNISIQTNGIYWVSEYKDQKIEFKNFPSIRLTFNSASGAWNSTFSNFDTKLGLDMNDCDIKMVFDQNVIHFVANGNILLVCEKQGNFEFKKGAILFQPNNVGAINFACNEKCIDKIAPVNSYLKKSNKIVNLHYFEIKLYNEISEIETWFFPYGKKSCSNDFKKTSPFQTKFIISNKIKTNLINKNGQQLTLNNKVEAIASYIEYKANLHFIHFSPFGEMKLESESNVSNFKVGASGTESVNSDDSELVLNFRKDTRIKVNKDENDLEPSLNSISTKPTIKYSAYNLDSEKSPIFKNSPINGEIPYESIPIRYSTTNVITDVPLPIIPTLSFKDNPELFELEEVFKKIRLKAHQEAKAKLLAKQIDEVEYINNSDEYITPQGFQKTTNGYEFISKESRFQFSLESIDINLDLSLRKDQVFFVLTPALFKEYCKIVTNAKFTVKFAINKETDEKLEFVVDLTSSYVPSASTDSESIVIFKFHREKLSTLINDLKLWTNEGFLNQNLQNIQKAITHAQSEIKNDSYFNGKNGSKGILNDENWNGVLIFNVPISNSENLPQIFKGLSSSQNFYKGPIPENSDIIKLDTPLKFQYVAFPVNKTEIENGKIKIKSTSFYGLIDYDPLKSINDKGKIIEYLGRDKYRFILSKLYVKFTNSSITDFDTKAFLKVHELFDDTIKIGLQCIDNSDTLIKPDGLGKCKDGNEAVRNLIKLKGRYQKKSSGEGEITFAGYANGNIEFDGAIIKHLELKKVGFSISEKDKYRFDIDAKVEFSDKLADINIKDLFSFDGLDFQNIGLHFNLILGKIPLPEFDLSKLIVLPTFSFNGIGFLNSFPIRLSHFQNFRLPVVPSGGKFNFGKPEFDFFPIKIPSITFDWPDWKPDTFSNLFSFIFDFDLGTLGNLGGLKDLKGQLLIGWTFKGGFAIGFKLNGPSTDGLHINLFGALKLDVEKLDFKQFKPKNQETCSAYFLRLVNAQLTVLGKKLPPIDGIIFSQPHEKIAWLINGTKIGFGQRVGPKEEESITSTVEAIRDVKSVFKDNLKDIDLCQTPIPLPYKPDRNYLVYSESILSEQWPIVLKFIFNDPKLYGLYLGFKGEILTGFSIDILYKKLSDSLGVYSTEIQLPDAVRNMDLGGASLRLPNIGIEIYSNGDWKGDVGFPKNGNDWSRSGFIQLRTAPPFVGWFGFYLKKSQRPDLTLFGKIPLKDVNIIQAGFAMRVGLGAYIDGGIYYVGASISVYGILEGAFAFKKDRGLTILFPDHFAILGRVGAIAELVGYVNFVFIKASIYISLRSEFGLLLVYLGEPIEGKEGIQPVKVYIEGEVVVAISVTLFCVKFFRKRWCLVIHLSFHAYVRFEYTIGGSDSSKKFLAKQQCKELHTPPLSWELESVKEIPMVLIPTFTRRRESVTDKEEIMLVNSFYIPFFGVKLNDGKLVPSKSNIFKDKIIQPLINDLIEKVEVKVGNGNATYKILRGILLDGKLDGVKVNITIPNYRPNFINGTNENDWNKLKAILEEEFYFKKYDDIDELEEFKKSIEIEDCLNLNSTNNKCPYRAVPAPISKNIKVNGKEINGGFDLKIEELVLANGASTVNATVKDLIISQTYLNKLEEYFNEYKTQFIDRTQPKFKEQDVRFDLRENFLIPEFFKLAALLTLEKSYSIANPKEKKGEAYNPFIKVSNGDILFSTDNTNWKPVPTNNIIEDVIGQLNYFYNSGLRLPKNELANYETISINELIDQSTVITPVKNPNPDAWKDVKISISGQDITHNILGTENDMKEGVEGIWKFLDSLESIDFTKLKNEFKPLKLIRPYKLINVTLSIQSNHKKILNSDNTENRLYEIPKKLFKHGSAKPNTRFSFELAVAQTDQKESNAGIQRDKVIGSTNPNAYQPIAIEKIEASKCLNIQIQVKKSVNTEGKAILELNNVLADDLTLITLLKEEQFEIESISFYGKVEENGQTKLIRLTNTGSTIIKTNLSPRTTPPLFETKIFNKATKANNLKQFLEDSSNSLDTGKHNFTRLVWEALTTNNGGYYLAFDNSKEFTKDLKEIVISFESNQNEVPYFFNTLNIKQNIGVFEGLDRNELYLYLEQINQDKEPVFEYHPTIPSHDFGFEIIKTQASESEYQQYLPLEFELLNNTDEIPVLIKDKILPILPSGPFKAEERNGSWELGLDKDGKKIEDSNGKLLYSHISPLITNSKSDDINNINRYSTVGKEYKLKLGLRDIYGFRTGINLEEKNYKHYYFDKLIPIDAWPLIKFSYWFKSYTENTDILLWTLSGKYDIRELLDLAAIPRDGSGEYKYRYQFGDHIISEQDKNAIANAAQGVLNSLYNTVAQLTDDRTELSMTNREKNKKDDKEKIKEKINLLIKDIESASQGKMPGKESQRPIEFDIATEAPSDEIIEKEIVFSININRKEDLLIAESTDAEYTSSDVPHSFMDLKSKASIWEYKAVEKVSTTIQTSNVDDGTSTLKLLNATIKEKTQEDSEDKKINRYSLAISVDKNLDKVLYIINEKALKQIKIKNNYLDGDKIKADKSYLGIKPISNKLWLGKYNYNDNFFKEFNTPVDLDKSLRVVLEKIDSLLNKDFISAELKGNETTFEKLITAKKSIAEKKLSRQVEYVMKDDLKPPDIDLRPQAKQEFKEINLNKLTNFYAYDGAVSIEVDGVTIPSDYRLSLSLETVKDYNLISSKITNEGYWNIFFDQEESIQSDIDININFAIRPKITHIEKDIHKLKLEGTGFSEIEKSTWIQLIDPVELSISSYIVDGWSKIIRKFPLKPVISKHEAVQFFSDESMKNIWSFDSKTKLPNAGKWEYFLSIEDRDYENNDQMDVALIIKSSDMRFNDNFKTFEGFVAYWADKIKENDFNWKDFVNDISLHLELNSESKAYKKSENSDLNTTSENHFVLVKKKVKEQREKWEIKTNLPGELKVDLIGDDSKPEVKVTGFNVFSANQVVFSILPIIKIQRNHWARNNAFKYETDEVQPASPVTPLIKFYRPLGINKSDLFTETVFKFKNLEYPYKATAKYLVDIDLKFPNSNDKPLPVIPIKQIESDGQLPDEIDEIFSQFDKANGYPAFSYTIYNRNDDNKDDANSSLPIFYADTIFRNNKNPKL